MTEEPAETDAGACAHRTTRRGVLAGAGVVGATALLAACSADAEPGGQPGADTSRQGGGDRGDRPERAIVAVDQVPVGGGFIDTERNVVVTRPAEDDWRAFSATCTHASCLVSSVNADGINCTCHGTTFSATDGSVIRGPAPEPLPSRPIALEDGWIVSA